MTKTAESINTDVTIDKKTKMSKKKNKLVEQININDEKNEKNINNIESFNNIEKIINIEKEKEKNNIDNENRLIPYTIPYIETPWKIIGSYFENQHLRRLVRHQIESYNDLIDNQIQRTIEMFNPVPIASEQDFDKKTKKHKLEIFVTFEKFNLYRPQIHENNGATKIMFPQEARLRNFTYASTMTIDMNIRYVIRTGENLENVQTFHKQIPKVHIGRLPIMLKSSICVLNQYQHINHNVSGECKYDAGGYFIINGSEKTVLGQERAAENKVYCFNVMKNNNKWSWMAEVKSVPDFKCISPKQINMMIANKNNGFGHPIYIQIPRVKQPIALFVVFRALGILSDKEICEKIVLDIDTEENLPILNSLQGSIIDSNSILTQEDALKHITSYVMYTPINMDKESGALKKREFTIDVLNNDLFPHCHNQTQKIYYLGYMANRLIQCSLDICKQDDRDSYLNKRIDLTGTLINNLFRNYFNKLVKDMTKQVVKEINTGSWRSTEDYLNIINKTNIYKIVKSTTIENGIKRALSTGDFGIKNVNSNKVGVAQVLNRLTYVSSLSHLRRINTPIDKSGKLIPPRKLHNTSWSFLCPAECFDPETPILMWDGSSKRAGDIVVGDILVDDLGNQTTVRTTCFGIKNMYDIIPEKHNFIKHRVTDNHILTLKIRGHKTITESNRKDRNYTHIVKYLNRLENKFQQKYFNSIEDAQKFINNFNDDDTLDITIENYLKLDKRIKDKLVLFKTESIHWIKKDVEMDPYLLGMWLGDGLSNGSGFALNYKTDFETLAYWEKWAQENDAVITKDHRYKFSVVSRQNKEATVNGLCNRVVESPLKKYLRKYNLLNNKHIPNEYLTNDRETRLKLLAGLIDTDGSVRANGHEIRICQGPANVRIIENTYTLAMSLGFCCGVKEGKSQWIDKKTGDKKFSTYKELTITGDRIYEIPTLLPRKKLCQLENNTHLIRCKSFMCSKFTLQEVGNGPYVGWQLHDKRGRFCLNDGLVVHNTPEGGSVGVVKNISYMTHITIPSNSESLYQYAEQYISKLENMTSKEMNNNVKVFINGAWIGNSNDPIELYHAFKEKKYKGIINIYTSIIFDYKNKEIRICNDAGRLTRPVLRVKNNNILISDEIIDKLSSKEISWDDLLTDAKIKESIIEYIDPDEQNLSMIAMKPLNLINNNSNYIYKYTHCEIHPSTIFGIVASCIPFPEHNQSPRNTYQSAMAKQAMGVYVTNFQNRMDKTAYVLTYPSRPLVDTRVMGMIKLDRIPSGTAVIVAIMTYTGYNQEDSILINKGSIDRGLFNATIYHTEKDEDKKINGDEEIRCKPDPSKTKSMKFGNYDKVNNRGVIPENTLVENRDIIIAKVMPIKENRNDHTKLIKYEDHSKIHRTTEETYIDKNFIDRNGDGYCIAKVKIRAMRKPVIGDKLSSRHGQKGTIGNIIPESDMPFTSNGMRPDIIINPHAIPSRMTIGQLKETLLGKVLVQLGLFGDGTSFGELNIKDICKELLKTGYECNGNELLYNGLTGEQIETSIFIGPAFYQRLKHMVNDKQHSRSIGPMVNLTRQPAEGRSRDGGLRFGEMERDCFSVGTPISLNSGLSINIEEMENLNESVLGWSESKNGMIPSNQLAFMNKGIRDCVQLTFEDGRKLTCTEDHPILTSDNTWVKVKDVELNSTKIKSSVNYPVMKMKDEIEECAGWTLEFGARILKTNTCDEFMKTLSFARILGLLITDGSISVDGYGTLFLGHILDVKQVVDDLKLFCDINQKKFESRNYYSINIPTILMNDILKIKGLLRGKKVNQPGTLPDFILDENCPRPIVREFLAGMFGGDGHTCVLGMHRGKRDIMSSVSFSKTKTYEHCETLQKMFENIQKLLAKCGIQHTTIQKPRETSCSKKKFENKDKSDNSERSFQLTLHVPIEELIPFSEKIGFRYCCHKSQRLEAGVSYRRLREEVTRQHNWIVNRVDEITNFKKIKTENPNKNVSTKKAIEQAVEELKKTEGLLHEYAIPSTHDITDHLIKGTTFGKFTSKSFPTAEEFMKKIGALSWFNDNDNTYCKNIDTIINNIESNDTDFQENNNDNDFEDKNISLYSRYGVNRELESLPTMNLTVISRIPVGPKHVYDISVDETHSFLANGIVAHNCMVSHGASRFTRGRLYDASDKYQVWVCKCCGMIAAFNDKVGIHCCKTCDNRVDFAYVEIPYSCKLLFQELQTMNIAPRIMT